MDLRPATEHDIDALAHLVVGDSSQASTSATKRLFLLGTMDDVVEINRVMISSTGGWRSIVVADDGEPRGMVQTGTPFLAFTPEVVEFARRHYGDGFEEVLGPRLDAQRRVQSTYPEGCFRISEIHVAPGRRGEGIGSALFAHVLERATKEGAPVLGLQTLTTNPARAAFEAWGFEVAATRTDAEFEEFSGAAGFHLMLRPTQR